MRQKILSYGITLVTMTILLCQKMQTLGIEAPFTGLLQK